MANTEARAFRLSERSEISLQDFDRGFELARARLMRICTAFVGVVEAEDVVQQTYLLARDRVAQLRDPERFDAWLNRIAVNLCFGEHRRRRRTVALPDVGVAQTRNSDLRELIERLAPRERTILVLHYGYGFKLQEVAELLSLSHGNVRTIIARTRRRLLQQWTGDE